MARRERQSSPSEGVTGGRRPQVVLVGSRRPQVVLVSCAAAAALIVLGGIAAGLPLRWIAILSLSVALTGIIESASEWRSLNRQRSIADNWLRKREGRSVSLSYGWRATELTSRRERRILACSLEAAAREARQRPGPIGATVVSRATVRPYTAELTTLAERLNDLRQPVSPTGMLLVRDLLTSPTSPLYEAVRAGEIPATIDNILETLDVTDRPA
jgi:hypothetical protein